MGYSEKFKEFETRLSNLEKAFIVSQKNNAVQTEKNDNAKNDILQLENKTKIIQTTRKQSDKLGYDWEITMVGDIEASKVYVEQENPVGISADNPIIWEEGIELINNAFYLKDGKIYVYMDGQFIEW